MIFGYYFVHEHKVNEQTKRDDVSFQTDSTKSILFFAIDLCNF